MATLWGEGAGWDLEGGPQPHEARLLQLDIGKAARRLGWKPAWPLDEGLKRTVDWYKADLNGADIGAFTVGQIRDYARIRAGAAAVEIEHG